MDRRTWMTGALGLGLAPASRLLAVSEPYERVGSALRVGLAAFSFREHFEYSRGEPNPRLAEGARRIDMPGFIEFCAEHGVEGAELTRYFFPPDADAAYFAMCRRIAHVNGVAVAGGAVGNNFTWPPGSPERAAQIAYVKEWIDNCTVLGAPHLRVFAGRHAEGVGPEEAERHVIEALEETGEYAGERGILLGLENHDSVGTAEQLLRIVKAVDSPWVGVNLDSGNFTAEDHYAEFAAAAPYSVNVQIKTEFGPRGARQPEDLERLVDILREAGYAGYVVLEYEEDKDPFENVPPVIERLRALCA